MTTTRRHFVGNVLGWFGIAAGIPAIGIAVSPKRDDYVPAGHIDATSWESQRVDYVTLDGKRVDAVVECHDVDGWLRCYVEKDDRNGPRIEYRTGVVRIHWLPRSLA